MKRIDWMLVAKFLVLAMILGAALSLVRPITRFADTYTQREMAVSAQAIDKALVECYALEGSYPSDLQYLVDHYGLILDTKHFVYQLDSAIPGEYIANFRPQVRIIPVDEAVEP